MQIALIGFSKSGKTTVFNALTGAHAEVSAYSLGKAQTHRATVQAPDDRLEALCAFFRSKKMVRATTDYVDPVGIRRDEAGRGAALGDDMLHAIADADALAAVVRGFDDGSGIAPDPEGDLEAISLELILSDLQKVDNRLERIDSQAQRVGGEQRKALQEEGALLERLKEALEAGRPARTLEFTTDEGRALRSFQFLTTKPLVAVLNTGDPAETRSGDSAAQAGAAPSCVPGDKSALIARRLTLCGQTEMEIAQLEPEERAEFLKEYGIGEAGASRMICASYDALDLISFFTGNARETRAWTIRRGSTALQAAGSIHSDMERGFIRAQVARWDDLLRAGSIAEAKKHAALRLEGKDYVVQDGDVIEIMFSV
jgi:hypothetical protein